jgi:hypothetical protein
MCVQLFVFSRIIFLILRRLLGLQILFHFWFLQFVSSFLLVLQPFEVFASLVFSNVFLFSQPWISVLNYFLPLLYASSFYSMPISLFEVRSFLRPFPVFWREPREPWIPSALHSLLLTTWSMVYFHPILKSRNAGSSLLLRYCPRPRQD